METRKGKRGRPKKALAFPPVHRAIMEPIETKESEPLVIFNRRFGWVHIDKGELTPVNSRVGASKAETAATSRKDTD